MKISLLVLLLFSSYSFAFEFDLEKLNKSIKHKVGPYSVIEYPEAPYETFEVTSMGNSLFAKSGNNLVVFHPKTKLTMVSIEDVNNDGAPDRIDYDIYDSKERYLGTTSDYNFDGQSDLKINVTYDKGTPEPSAAVWIKSEWHQIHEQARNSEGLVNRFIILSGKKVSIDISKYPFKLGN